MQNNQTTNPLRVMRMSLTSSATAASHDDADDRCDDSHARQRNTKRKRDFI